MAESEKLVVIFADGGSRGNPGPAGSGAVIKLNDENGEVLFEIAKYLGETTNNVAEYTALVLGLEKAWQSGFHRVHAYMDSELVVRQMIGQYRVKNEKLKPLFIKAQDLSRKFSHFEISHVRREKNKEADALANKAMDMRI